MNLIEELEKLDVSEVWTKKEGHYQMIRKDKVIAIIKKHMLTKQRVKEL